MRRSAALLLPLLTLAAASAETPPATPPNPRLEALTWMVGSWQATIGGVEMEDLWLSPKGGMMLGVHRDVAPGRASFEFQRIAQSGAGIVFLASPGGQPPTSFPLKELGDGRVVFENPQHDFPQRILYWRSGADRLCARVEGSVNGKVEGEEWCWSRVQSP